MTASRPFLVLNLPLVQACLNAPEPTVGNDNGVDAESAVESPEESAHAHMPAAHGLPRGPSLQPGYMTAEQQQHALAYQSYMAQHQASRANYSLPTQPSMPPHQPPP